MQLDIYRSIRDISASDWDHWFGGDYPFLRHDFLLGLEDTGCTTQDSGWAPHHMVLRDGSKVVGAAPGFLKEHSYGEYVLRTSPTAVFSNRGAASEGSFGLSSSPASLIGPKSSAKSARS